MQKRAVASRLVEGRHQAVTRGAGLRRVANPAAGLIPLSDAQAVIVWVAVVSCLGFAFASLRSLPLSGAVALGLVVGGASSNLFDRVVRGAVVDFIVVGRWPAFNLADAAMVAGTAVAAWSAL